MDYTDKIQELVNYLNHCRFEYYNNNNSIITDEQYDSLFDELKKLEEVSGIIFSNSPTQQIGFQVLNKLKKVEHYKPLLSLDKVKSYEDVIKFCASQPVLFMHKLDGLTVQLTYQNGELFKAETRGDGIIGEDITHNIKTVSNVPKKIPIKDTIRITGEAIVNIQNFNRLNETIQEESRYSNPRNFVSGSVRQLDSSVCSQRHIEFVVWNANDLSENGCMDSGLYKAKEFGFSVVHYIKKEIPSVINIEKIFNNMKYKASLSGTPIDGIVIMFNNISFGESLGRTSHHFRNGVAFKFYDTGYITNLTGFEYSVGKTGVLTPVAIFEPVDIDGANVTKASLHNISILEKLNLVPGDSIEVYRANEVIPQVRCNNTAHEDKNIYKNYIPTKCPHCGCSCDIVENLETGIKNLLCTNETCKGILLKKLEYYVSREGMNIDGLSEKTLSKLIDLGYIRKFKDLYCNINPHRNELMNLYGFGNKSITYILDSIKKSSNNIKLSKLLCSISIPNIGKTIASQLSSYFHDNVEELIMFFNNSKSRDSSVSILCNSITGIGDVIVSSFIDWFMNDKNMEEFKDLISVLTFNDTTKSDVLSGKIFAITGSLKQHKCRDDLVTEIESYGGQVSSSVTKTTSYLINNDITSSSSKNMKARQLNIPIITEEDFINMLGAVKLDSNEPKPTTSKKKLF